MNIVTLTPEQKQFAEDNHSLVFAYLNKNKLCDDDYYDVVVFGFLEAVKQYSTNAKLQKYAFSTISWRFMHTSRRHHDRYRTCPKRKVHTVSLDAKIGNSGTQTIGDILDQGDMLMDELEIKFLMHDLASRVSKQQMDVIQMRIEGYPMREISSTLKITMKSISQMLEELQSVVLDVCYG